MNDKVSIIIPVYNAAKYIRKCLSSVVNQTYQNFEAICVNDGSTDESEAILNEYKQQYPEKFHVTSIPNGGQANARNIGISLANGTFLCFVDSDDTLSLDMLEKMIGMIHYSDSDMVVCEIKRVFEGKVSFLEKHFSYDTLLNINETTTIYEHPEIICYLTAAPFAKLIRKDFLEQNKIRFIKGYIYEDLVFTQTVLSFHPKITFLNEKLYMYLVRNNSTMTSKNSRVSDMFVSFENLYNAYKQQNRTEDFKQELDYLCLYHVMIGTSYRLWRSRQCSLVCALKECRDYVRKYQCDKHNRYISEKGMISKIFIFLFAPRPDRRRIIDGTSD